MDKKSFTLLELVIVLALLAILASYAIARFVDLRCKSLFVIEQTIMNSLRTAVILYYARYNAWPDWANDDDPATPGPFDLLENAPANMNNDEWGNPGNPNWPDNVHWYWQLVVPVAAFATGVEFKCPHMNQPASPSAVDTRWYYVLRPGQLPANCGNPTDKVYSPGAVIRCANRQFNHCL